MRDFPAFPAWFYGPNGESGVFDGAADVPEGWRDSPAAFAVVAEAAAGEAMAEFVAAVPDAAPAVAEVVKRGPGRPRKDAA